MNVEDFVLPQEFPSTIRTELFKENGEYCLLCGKKILQSNSFTPIGKNNATIHHVVFVSAGGLGTKSNALVCCRECHDKIHNFLDCFIMETKEDFDFFTTAYIWFFTEKMLDYSLYRRFHYSNYACSLNSFARMFRNKVKKQKAICRRLLTVYTHYSDNYADPMVKKYISKTYSESKMLYDWCYYNGVAKTRLLLRLEAILCD